jgi:starvation-inducible DNA-binding protein
MMEIEKPELVMCTAECLSNAVVMYFKAHGHHWNVEGQDFSEYHNFFQEIYEDVYSAIDPLAEEIRKLGAPAPYRLSEFSNLSMIEDSEVGSDIQSMIQDLLASNKIVIAHLNRLFDLATNQGEQGLANLAADRLSMHKKWGWQLKASLKSDNMMELEY